MKRFILALFLFGCNNQGLQLVPPDSGSADSVTGDACLTQADITAQDSTECQITQLASVADCSNTKIQVPSPGITLDMVVYVNGSRLGRMGWVRSTEIWGNEWYSPDGHTLIITKCDNPASTVTIGVSWGCE